MKRARFQKERVFSRKAAALSLLLLLLCCVWSCARIRPPKNAVKTARTFEVTGYCKCKQCCGWRRTWYGKPVVASGSSKGKRKRVGITASGKEAKEGRTIAADTSKYPFGTIMYVPGYGYGRVEDRGGAIKGERLDLYFKNHQRALEWGRQDVSVTVWLPRTGKKR